MGIGYSGNKAWVYGPGGLVCDDGGRVRAVLGAEALGYDVDNARGAIISAHQNGGHLVNGEGELLAFDEEGAVKPQGRKVYALAAIDDDRWAIATREGREVVVRVGLRGAESVRLRSPRQLDKTEVPLAWRGGETPFTRKKRMSETPGRLRLRATAGALALADADSGVVALWREGLMDWALSFRVPANAQSELEAHPWRDSVAVAIRSDTGEGCLLCFDASGEACHSLVVADLGPTAIRGEAVVFTDGTALKRWVPGSEPETLVEAEYLNAGGEIVATPDGRYLFQQDARTYWLEQGEGDKARWLARPLPAPKAAAGPMVLAKTNLPRRTKSPPQLELDAMVELLPWDVRVGDGSLTFPLVMTGGAASNLVVEIQGPGAKLFTPKAARLSGAAQAAVTFEGKRALLECDLNAGVEVPEPPKSVARRKADAKQWRWEQIPEDCRTTLTIEGVATGAGSALLTVRVSFESHGRTGSLLRGQMINVS